MKYLAALLLMATLVSCAGPAPEPTGDVAVVEPGVACRVNHNGAPTMAERGIGGTGAVARSRVVDRGIGGTGIIGVVTGFASICVDGLEVTLDKSAPVFINGAIATTGQLRAGQLVVIQAGEPGNATDSAVPARTIAVRYEVSGPIETVDARQGIVVVARQRVVVLPTTWIAGRFGIGSWTTVSGLRQPDGTIVASRLEHGHAGALAVRGQISREGDVTHIGGLILRGPTVAALKAGTFVSIVGKYKDGAADVTAIEPDLLAANPTGYFGTTIRRMVVQGFVRVDHGLVNLNNGQNFRAGPRIQGKGSGYRNAIVWLDRGADGLFSATDLHYTAYRAQPKAVPTREPAHRPGDVSPPFLPPWMPPDLSPAGVTDDDSGASGAPESNPDGGTPIPADGINGIDPTPVPSDVPTSKTVPSEAHPATDGLLVADAKPAVVLYAGGQRAYLAAR